MGCEAFRQRSTWNSHHEALDFRSRAGRQASLHPRRLQRPDQERRDRRRHADQGLAADDSVRARQGRDRHPRQSHLGRPKGKVAPEFSLQPLVGPLASTARPAVVFASDCVGEAAAAAVAEGAQPAATSCCSRTCASTPRRRRTTRCLRGSSPSWPTSTSTTRSVRPIARTRRWTGSSAPSAQGAAGFLMEKELKYLGHAVEHPVRPFVAIIGGAKVSDKIEVIDNLLNKVDALLIGGAMAYTFFKSRNMPVGKSLVEDDRLDSARAVTAKAAAARRAARTAGRSRRRAEARSGRAHRGACRRRRRHRRAHGARHRARGPRRSTPRS